MGDVLLQQVKEDLYSNWPGRLERIAKYIWKTLVFPHYKDTFWGVLVLAVPGAYNDFAKKNKSSDYILGLLRKTGKDDNWVSVLQTLNHYVEHTAKINPKPPAFAKDLRRACLSAGRCIIGAGSLSELNLVLSKTGDKFKKVLAAYANTYPCAIKTWESIENQLAKDVSGNYDRGSTIAAGILANLKIIDFGGKFRKKISDGVMGLVSPQICFAPGLNDLESWREYSDVEFNELVSVSCGGDLLTLGGYYESLDLMKFLCLG